MQEDKSGHKKQSVVAKTAQFQARSKTINTNPDLLIAQVNRKLHELLSTPPLDAGLYLVATPIGNLSDISLRALTTLAKVDAIYCEDTRHSKKLLSHYGISQKLYPYHDHSNKTAGIKLLSKIKQGDSIALISDAGTPLISDPGYHLVSQAHKQNLMVTALPGPSALTTAVSLAGLPSDSFLFIGFLPPKSHARLLKLEALKSLDSTLIFYESPKRIHKTLNDMQSVFANRYCVIAKELSKLHETLYQGSVQDLCLHSDTIIAKGEFVVLLAPTMKDEKALSDEQIKHELLSQTQNLSLRDAVQTIAKTHNLSKKRVYALGLALKKQSSDSQTSKTKPKNKNA